MRSTLGATRLHLVESPIKGKDLTSAQLETVTEEVLEELVNMDQTPVQHDLPMETTLEQTGARDALINTGGEFLKYFFII